MATQEIKNIRNTLDKKIAKLYQDFGNVQIISRPPHGMCKILNIYVNPNTGKLEAVYDDTPAP